MAKKKYADPSSKLMKQMMAPSEPPLDYKGRPGARMKRIMIDINLEEEAEKRDRQRRRRNDNREAPRNTTGPRG